MDFEELTEEQRTKARGSKTAEELAELGATEGDELIGERLEGISAGRCPDACGARYPIGA